MPFPCLGQKAVHRLKRRRPPTLKARDIVRLAWQALEEKSGLDLVALDLRRRSPVAQYFLLVSGTSDRHVRTLAEHVLEVLGSHRVTEWHVDGLSEGRWVLLDYADVMIHVFHPQTRSFYGLERLWGEAPRLEHKPQ